MIKKASIIKVEIFTDGACRGNPGPGGWAALLRYGEHEKELFGGELYTTNNRMELSAAIEGLGALKRKSSVVVVTDSNYVRQGITEWLPKWKKHQWRTSGKKAVKNQDLWERLDKLAQFHFVEWKWVKAHNGHPENERVDELARTIIDKIIKENCNATKTNYS